MFSGIALSDVMCKNCEKACILSCIDVIFLGSVQCEVPFLLALGDHQIVVVEVDHLEADVMKGTEAEALLYRQRVLPVTSFFRETLNIETVAFVLKVAVYLGGGDSIGGAEYDDST